MADNISRYFSIFFIVLIVFLSFRILQPFYSAIIAAIILSFISYPIFEKLNQHIKNKNLVILIMILMALILCILPIVLIINILLKDLIGFYYTVQTTGINFSIEIPEQFSFLSQYLKDAAGSIASGMIKWLGGIVSSLPEKFISGVVMIFSMVLFLKEGPKILKKTKKIIPLENMQKDQLLAEFKNVTTGVVFGMVVTMIMAGILGGIGFWIFGIPNPALWGMIMSLLSFIPIMGVTPVYVGGAIYLLYHGLYLKFGFFIVFAIIAANIDQFIIPRIIGRRAKINPIVSLVGILGGIKIFGLIGIVVGPLTLSLLITIIKFYTSNFKKEFKI